MRDSSAAYSHIDSNRFLSHDLTRGPWDPAHQHAGPPSALVCRAVEHAASAHGLTHLSRLTTNLLRPVPIAELEVHLHEDYVGKNTGHFSGELVARGKAVLRFTALAQRENPMDLPEDLPGHPWPKATCSPEMSEPTHMPFAKDGHRGYADLIENRAARGTIFQGPCAIWFRLQHPLVPGEEPSPFQRTAVAADSGNGISAILDFRRFSFINSDLTINWLRRPQGEWICLDAQTWVGDNGCALAESSLYDDVGLIGRATQSLSIRGRK
ncbi:MAG: thioesterase family protein [Gammaproteobacteria bacterium]|nr:thioesterase family protein [Gammaproteobacteria bacterium]MCB1881718.1 thioesterase family protein [Gammaproteobacteria bacterium]